jgi:hypothetical protein
MSDKERVVTILDRDWHSLNMHANATLDPHRHGFEPGGHPFMDNKCARCHLPRAEHWGLLRRLVARVLRWRK